MSVQYLKIEKHIIYIKYKNEIVRRNLFTKAIKEKKLEENTNIPGKDPQELSEFSSFITAVVFSKLQRYATC